MIFQHVTIQYSIKCFLSTTLLFFPSTLFFSFFCYNTKHFYIYIVFWLANTFLILVLLFPLKYHLSTFYPSSSSLYLSLSSHYYIFSIWIIFIKSNFCSSIQIFIRLTVLGMSSSVLFVTLISHICYDLFLISLIFTIIKSQLVDIRNIIRYFKGQIVL